MLTQTKSRGSRIKLHIFLSICAAFLLYSIYHISHADIQFRKDHHSSQPKKQNKKVYFTDETGVRREAKVAFATFMTGGVPDAKAPIDSDVYYVSTETLVYQILWDPETRTKLDAPMIVFTTPTVREDRIAKLRSHGATVIPVPHVVTDWALTEVGTWQEVFSKLYLFDFTEYDLILMMDNDSQLTKNIDDIFEDPAVKIQKSLGDKAKDIPGAKKAPETYLIAGVPELFAEHNFPPTDKNHDFPNYWYLDAGFFIARPSRAMLDYLFSILAVPNSFPPHLPEQNLLNKAFDPLGNMPWAHLGNMWNAHHPKGEDVKKGVYVVHDKVWRPDHIEMLPYLLKYRWKMQGYYEGLEKTKTTS